MEHEVKLIGLLPDTQYYYSVGTTTGTLAGGDSAHFFLTSPELGTAKPTRIWIIGDSGTAGANARAVRDAYVNFAGTRYTDLWLMLGDNAYPDGTDSEYQAAVFTMYPSFLKQTVLWPTLGNHDGHTADSATQTGPYYNIFTLPKNGEAGGRASGTEAYYSFDYGNIHFICLDSYETNRAPGSPMLTWLKADLDDTVQDWIIAFWHHPPYSKGSHNSDTEANLIEMRQNVLPILEDYGVDLVLTGHSHSYERSFLLDGHYGSSSTLTSAMIKDSGDGREDGTGAYMKPTGLPPHAGAVYAVAGSSGQTSGGALNHPAMFISLNLLGSMVLDIDGDRLDAKFLTKGGAIQDYFTIQKGNVPPPVSTVVFQDGVFPWSTYSGTRDTFISEAQPNKNFGTATSLNVDGDEPAGTGKDRAVLLKWASLTVPAGSTVQSATITLNITNTSAGTYELYEMKRDWSEARVTWERYVKNKSWQVSGANGALDRGTTVLGTVTASALGQLTVTLNAPGIALVQSWVGTPTTNYGLILTDSAANDEVNFTSSEGTTAGLRPKLTVTYVP
jgi:hypothetical protein